MRILALTLLLFLTVLAQQASAECDVSGLAEGTEVVEISTTLGTVCIELFAEHAPQTVENFRWYVSNDQIAGTFFHDARFSVKPNPSDPQGLPVVDEKVLAAAGALVPGISDLFFEDAPVRMVNDEPYLVPDEPCTADTPVEGEPGNMICSEYGNERGTIALWKTQPNSGSNAWFVNMQDNRELLDTDSVVGGYTVFGRVLGDGMDVVDKLVDHFPFEVDGNPREVWGGQWAQDLPFWVDPRSFWIGTLKPPAVSDVRFYTVPPWEVPACFDSRVPLWIIDHEDPNLANSEFDLVNYPPPIDPQFGFAPYILSIGCATATTLEDFVPDPGPPECPDPDILGIQVNSPTVLGPITDDGTPTGNFRYYSLSCEQVQTAIQKRDEFRIDFRDRYIAELAYVDSTVLSVVPEPSAPLLAGGALVAMALLRRGRRGKH